MTPTRATTRAIGASALVALLVALVAAPAHASAYRYWTYWQAPGGAAAWAFATQGPGTAVPAEGDVEGWAFGITTESGNLDDAPTATPDFEEICAGTVAVAGQKRVALVIDTGVDGIAPAGQRPPASTTTCVTAPEDATGYEILRSVADVRVENGLVCAVADYPVGECAPVLDDAEARELLAAAAPVAGPGEASAGVVSGMDAGTSADAVDGAAVTSSTPLATLAVGILLIAGAAFWYARGRRGR